MKTGKEFKGKRDVVLTNISFGGPVILGFVSLLFVLPIILEKVSVFADGSLCEGTHCNNKDPKDNGCDEDANTITSTTIMAKDNTGSSQYPVRLEMRHSQSCNASWVRSNAPANSTIYIEDIYGNSLGKSNIPNDGYDSHYSDMASGDQGRKACLKLVNEETAQCTKLVY